MQTGFLLYSVKSTWKEEECAAWSWGEESHLEALMSELHPTPPCWGSVSSPWWRKRRVEGLKITFIGYLRTQEHLQVQLLFPSTSSDSSISVLDHWPCDGNICNCWPQHGRTGEQLQLSEAVGTSLAHRLKPLPTLILNSREEEVDAPLCTAGHSQHVSCLTWERGSSQIFCFYSKYISQMLDALLKMWLLAMKINHLNVKKKERDIG